MARNQWRDIRARIEEDITGGILEPGAKLPTEAELAAKYAAGRHSVRRAVAELAKQGFLSVEQGRGTFVLPHTLLEYSIGSRTRLRKSLGTQVNQILSKNLGSEEVGATPRVAEGLRLDVGAPVLATRMMSIADGVPLCFGTLYHDIKRFPDFPARSEELGSVSAVYRSYDIEDYLRGHTQIHARPARSDEAQQLQQHPDMPVIVVRAIDTLPDDTPIAFTQVVWSAARVKFSFPG